MVALRSRDTLYCPSRFSLNSLSSKLMMLRPYLHYRKNFSFVQEVVLFFAEVSKSPSCSSPPFWPDFRLVISQYAKECKDLQRFRKLRVNNSRKKELSVNYLEVLFAVFGL